LLVRLLLYSLHEPYLKIFLASQKSQFTQHIKTEKHNINKELKTKRTHSQAHLEDLMVQTPKKSKSEEVLGRELCEAFLAANIPWKKLENSKLKNFLETNLGIAIPDESTLRKKYMDNSNSREKAE